MPAELIAGLLSGVAGLMTFLIIHHFWIRPIWFILPVGLVIAGLGGMAAGWAYAEIRLGLPPRPWTSLALAGVIGAILAPSILIAELREPLFDFATGTIPAGQRGRAAAHFVLELVVTAAAAGALAGWVLAHTRGASIATAVAGLAFALGPGHNIPFLGNSPAVGKGLALLLAITLVSALVLVEAHAWMGRE